MSMPGETIVADTTILTLTSYPNKFVSFSKGFIIAKFLYPSLYGHFSGLNLISIHWNQVPSTYHLELYPFIRGLGYIGRF